MGDIVLENPNAAAVLEKFGLDYCCHGNLKLADACKIKFMDPSIVAREIREVAKAEPSGNDPLPNAMQWELPRLIDYIIETHHSYVRKMIPIISEQITRSVESYGTQYPQLYVAQKVFAKIAVDLQAHTKKEEELLFPAIRKLTGMARSGQQADALMLARLAHTIADLKYEHEVAGNEMVKIHESLNDLNPPPNVCATMKLMYQQLTEYERDLRCHVFLENFVLFPRAQRLEHELTSGAMEMAN
ncbi:MAG: DUF542 domain-containing protein [Bacteroidota bacterium]|nr:DUF542 domain-containing protein [Bacteroidota bacterium]MDP4229635.1 DUF542 domain-containing protein [Bacteroidota bacterium]MDP4234909.1 DUF542 domain-containing protein [Bacteroidota bacterium]